MLANTFVLLLKQKYECRTFNEVDLLCGIGTGPEYFLPNTVSTLPKLYLQPFVH